MASTTTRRRTTKAKSAPPPEPEVDEIEELDEDEVEDLEVDDEEAELPKRKSSAKKAAAKKSKPADDEDDEDEAPAKSRKEITHGTQWLAEHVNKILGTDHKAYDLRVLLRKMAKKGELEREVGSDRSRYDFSGPKDATVLAVLKKLKSGELEKDRKEKLDELKKRRAASKKKGKPVAVEDDEVGDDLTDEDVDELDDDE